MTKEDFIGKGGTVCPSCGTWEIEGESVEICEYRLEDYPDMRGDNKTATHKGTAEQELSCSICGCEWLAVYELANVVVRRAPQGAEGIAKVEW